MVLHVNVIEVFDGRHIGQCNTIAMSVGSRLNDAERYYTSV